MTTGEAQPVQRVWAEFGNRLRGFIARRVDNPADADDILQEVFLRIIQRHESVQRPERLGAWLFQVTRNAIADHYRAPERRREVIASAGIEPALDGRDDAAQAAEAERDAVQAQRELATCLRPMVERLPEIYRDAVVLADLDGLTQREVAERLGLSISGAKARVQRGRRSLKTVLQGCCRVQLDAGGRITAYEAQTSSCHAHVSPCRSAGDDGPICASTVDHR